MKNRKIEEGIKMDENEIGKLIVDTAINLHKNLGSGLLESVYEVVLAKLLTKKGLFIQRQVSIPIEFEGEYFNEGFRLDLFIEGKVIIEIKSVEKIIDAHKKQLLTYLKLTNTKLGFILNFGAGLMKDGIVRIVNGIAD
jgi:GxxExxY protein